MKRKEEKLARCPICKSADLHDYLSVQDYFQSGEIFHLDQCAKCDFIFTNPRPDTIAIKDYYKSDKYYSHADSRKGIIQRVYTVARKMAVNNKYRLLNSLASNQGCILDYGCGTGEVLSKFKSKGWKTRGVEPDENSRNYAQSEHKLDVFSPDEFFNDKAENKYDLISMWHVLEHIHNLDQLILSLKQALKENGVFVIAVPDIDSFDAKHYKQYWAAYDVPRHLYHFNTKSISTLLSNYGFELIDKYPMKMDSYYVSLLSEEYKSGSKKILKSMFIGFKSNFVARSKKSSCSSTIFIFKTKNQ